MTDDFATADVVVNVVVVGVGVAQEMLQLNDDEEQVRMTLNAVDTSDSVGFGVGVDVDVNVASHRRRCRRGSSERLQTNVGVGVGVGVGVKSFRRKPVEIFVLALVLIHAGLLFQVGDALMQSHYVHWNTSNPIFRIDNTDHIIDVNRGNKPWEYDQVNIICPVYRPGTHQDDIETYVIYSVSKEEYDSCRITNPNPRVIAICNKPHELMLFTITFRSFTPTPGGLEFQPGEDYYFISTSAKGDLYRRVGGHCSSHHMKMAFKVANNQNDDRSTTSRPARPVVNIPRQTSNVYSDVNDDTDVDVDARSNETDNSNDADDEDDLFQTFWSGKGFISRPGRPIPPSANRPSKKRDDSFERRSNDVVKHEASRMASRSSVTRPTSLVAVVSIIVVFIATTFWRQALV